MYTVILIPTEQFPAREQWFEADRVRDSGDAWEFVTSNGQLVCRLKKARVESFEVATELRRSGRRNGLTVGGSPSHI